MTNFSIYLNKRTEAYINSLRRTPTESEAAIVGRILRELADKNFPVVSDAAANDLFEDGNLDEVVRRGK